MTTPGTASTSDARKRAAEADQHWTHPDPAVRALIAQAEKRGAVEALRDMATEFREEATAAWGHGAAWVTNGTSVAELAATWCLDTADRLDAQDGGEGRG